MGDIAKWLFGQLLSYSIASWIFFIAIASCTARFGGRRWVIPGHIAVALMICFLDVRWIQSEMHKPGWNGTPDQDGVFMIGLFVRILLINTTLLPVTALCIWLKNRKSALPPSP